MRVRFRVLFLCATTAMGAGASAGSLETLVTNPPFGTKASTAAGAAAEGPLEFRGVFVYQGETYFSISDSATRRSIWVGLKEAGNPFVVQSYDPAAGTIALEYNGRTTTITLKQAKIVSLPPPQAPAPAVAAGSPVMGTVAATANPPSNASPEELARYARIAEEIQRRRAARAQALQSNPQSAAQPAPPPSPNSSSPETAK